MPHDLPADRGGHTSSVSGAEIVAVRLVLYRERAEHGHRIRIVEGKRQHRVIRTC